MAKLSPKWIAMCTAAIGLAYSAGYIVTEPKAIAVTSVTQSAQVQSDSNTSSATTDTNQKQTSQKQKSTNKSTTATKQSGYKDGTYSGQGMNQIGSVAVSVTIKQGKIASVQITDCTTSYPQSAIDPLPGQVVSRQSANVDNVSGATESTSDFVTAISQALAQAKA
jgi:Uncharacterized protein conserved in bacteria